MLFQGTHAIINTMEPENETERIAWHPAFHEAVQLEFEPYWDYIEFVIEQQLTSEPLKIDVVIIKKKEGVVIDKTIGRIFRGYNIVEFKSHTDSLSIDDFYKTRIKGREDKQRNKDIRLENERVPTNKRVLRGLQLQ